MPKILITNAYSARNRGDAAIIAGMAAALFRTEAFVGATLTVSSSDYPADAGRYPFEVLPSFQSFPRALARRPRLRRAAFLLAVLPSSLIWAFGHRILKADLWLPRGLRRLLRAYAEADLIIAAGGGYLYTTSRFSGNVVLLCHLWSFLFGALLGKPVYLWAQSVGPFAAGFQVRLVRRALSRTRLVLARETPTARLLGSWGPAVRLRQAADAAFLLPAEEGGWSLPRVEGTARVGLTVRKWFRAREAQAAFEAAVARFVAWLAGEGRDVFFIPQVTCDEGGDDDRAAARDIMARLASRERVHLIEAELTAGQVKSLCGAMDFFVGTRMHSNIFALSMLVPTLAIGYQPKTAGIMEELGLSEFVVPIEGLDAGALEAGFRRLCERGGAVREALARRIPEMERWAMLAARLIEEDYLRFAGSRPAS